MATQQRQQLAVGETAGEDHGRTRADELWVELEIDRKATVSCPAATYGNETVDGSIQLTGTECHATIRFADESTPTEVVTTPIDDMCTCNIVCKPGITPSDLLIEDGSLIINAFVDSRDTLLALSDRLRESEDEWHLRRLQSGSEWSGSETDQTDQFLDEVSLTEKQREIVHVAVSKGYYANPREASLSDLAEEVGVTRSALSQRLNAVEAKLIETLAVEL
ncbi:helix-turn-helix domain-containing protein [Halodesulfurarchaeum sp.]|uniref:helix-turn-helix domain-containing protein n=1 Tax=Halodesulfurarchaeum sp. TaxID=1980530 RepID=UPI001BBF2708|nr:helix-turn-helix domain-containing protein [Halodesulfurarchaeum sp.]